MPQPLLVAVVCSDADRLRTVTKGARISMPGVAPEYALVSLEGAAGKRVIDLARLERERVILWIALDDVAEEKCVVFHRENLQKDSYSRGFYDSHLPEAVLKTSSKNEFEDLVSKVYEAFWATS